MTHDNMSEHNVKKIAKKKSRFRKAPGAPKRFKSAYIFFSTDMMQKIKREQESSQCDKQKITDISKRISQAWKDLSSHERQRWNLIAKQDKERFVREKMNYKGPWQLPVKIECQDIDMPPSSTCVADAMAPDTHTHGAMKIKYESSSFTDDSETTPRAIQPPYNEMRAKVVSQEERDAAHNLVTLFRQSNQLRSSSSHSNNGGGQEQQGRLYGDFYPSLQLVMDRNGAPPIASFHPPYPRCGPFF